MKESKQNNRAEDILANDSLYKKLKEGKTKVEWALNEREVQLARKMQEAIKDSSVLIESNDKLLLKKEIVASIKKYRVKRIIISMSSAAAILAILVISSVLYLQSINPSDIGEYAENVTLPPIPDKTLLILQDAKEVHIGNEESKIEYTKDGGKIKIDANKEIDQDITQKDISYNTVVVPYGKRTQIILPDNSKIWLNSGSKLVYPVTFSNKKREVFLEGEALFEVTHNTNQPFYVISRDIQIKVLGTVFNVSAYYDDEFTSTVLEKGSVELKYKSNALLKQSKLQITPGTLAIYDPAKKAIQQQKVDTRYYTSWRDGIFIFESEPLVNITKKLSRYYNIKLTLKNQKLSKETFSGYLDLKKSALQVLQVIGETTDFELTEGDFEIIIN